MRVTVLLSNEEYAEVRMRAGLVPLSRWFKNLALGEGMIRGKEAVAFEEFRIPVKADEKRKEDRTKKLPRVEEISMGERGAGGSGGISPPSDACEHGYSW